MVAEGRPPPLWWRRQAATFVLALNKAHVLPLSTAHALRLNKADFLALNRAHVLRLNTKICPVFTADTKETTGVGRQKAAPLCGGGRRPPPLCSQWLVQKKNINFEEKVLTQAAQLPQTSGLFERKVNFLSKSSAPGSAVAPDKWLVQKEKSEF